MFFGTNFPVTGRDFKGPGEKLADNDSFNTLTHFLVPEHKLLTDEEADAVLQKLGVTRDKLPKIKTSDAAMQILATIVGPIPEGKVVKITRESETAGTFVAYRLVTEG